MMGLQNLEISRDRHDAHSGMVFHPEANICCIAYLLRDIARYLFKVEIVFAPSPLGI